jgi:uncharacterized membrane protein
MKNIKFSKKGQLNTLTPNIVAVIVAVIFIIIGVVIIAEIRDTDLVSKANTGSVVNQTLTTVTEKGELITQSSSPACQLVADTVVVKNASSISQVINSGNYTISGCRISYVANSGDHNNSDWNVTASYTYGDEAYAAGNESLIGLASFSDFIGIIVLAIVAVVVIGIILAGFALRGQQR